MNILLLIGGLILILLGANGLTDGAASVAKRFRIPPIVIGLTIVAFGTSAPELTVSVSSALKGSADIAIGNVVGSNIFNTLMIVGCTALFAPIVITRNTLRKEIPLCILSSIVLLICANDAFLDKAPENILNRVDGLLLLCFFLIFMGYTFAIASKPVTMEQQAEHPVIEEETEIKSLPWWQSILYIIGGLAALIYGGQLFVDGATGIARNLGVSESIIGLTLVASSIVLLICANDAFLDKAPENILNRVDGLLLLCFFLIFMGYTFAIASKPVTMEQQAEHPVIEEETEIKSLPWWQSILYIIGGLAALIYGGQLFVDGATGIARNLGVSESIIGLTLVAGGTSLPELATSIVAALKKNPEIAIGNVIGSNLFNIFFVLGCSASITPLHLSGITNFDLFTLVGSGILLWLFGLFFAKRTITRIEGAIMILCYVAYTVVLIYNT